MRRTLIAAATLMALSTAAQAQVDHMNLTYPACVTPFHLSEADALWHAGRPVNKDFCIMLNEGTEVVRVSYPYPYHYMQIAYQVNGKTFTLFTNPSAMKGVVTERKADAERDKQDEQAADAFMKTVGGDAYERDNLRRAWFGARSCHRAVWHPSYVRPCDSVDEDLRKLLAKVQKNDGLRAEIDVLETKHHRCIMISRDPVDPICKGIADAIEDKKRETFNRKHSN